jgi:hypothetical protein
LIFSWCEQETETETTTVTVNNGVAADLGGLQELLATEGVNTVDFYGTLAIGDSALIIPAGKTVTVKDGEVTLSANGILVVLGTLTLPDGEKITGQGTVVAPEAFEDNVSEDATFAAIQSGGATIVPADVFAVSGDITISDADTSATNIKNTAFTNSTTALFVIGSLTVSKPIGQAITVAVLGNATVSDTETGDVNWLVSGTLTASKTPTTGAGTIDVGGNATFTEALASTGTINVDGAATFGAALTTGAGALTAGSLEVTGAASLGGDVTVKGGATFASTVTNTAAAELTVGGASTITGVLTVGTGGLTIAGAGAVSLTAKPVVADSKALTISSAGGVTLADGIAVSAAGGLVVSGEGAKVIIPDEKKIAITGTGTALFGANLVTLSGVGDWTATKAITITGYSTTGVKITSSEADAIFASSGSAPKLSLAASTALDIGSTVTLALAGDANGIAFTGATSTVALNAGAKITGTAATTLEAKSDTTDGSAIKLTATDGTNDKFTFTTAGVVTASATVPSTDVTLTLGKSEWKSTDSDNSSGVASTVAGTAAIGSLSAGTDTTVTLAGASA